MTQTSGKFTRYIPDQQWSLLTEFQRPWDYLHTAQFRVDRPQGAAAFPNAADAETRWRAIDPEALVAGVWELDGQHIDLNRVVITTDAGIGKTTATEWLSYRFNLPGSNWMAFRVTSRYNSFAGCQ